MGVLMRKSAKADLRGGLLFCSRYVLAEFLTGGAWSPIPPAHDRIKDEDRCIVASPPPYPLGHGERSRVIVVVPPDQAPRHSFPDLLRGV
jgi:hypothetical protein